MRLRWYTGCVCDGVWTCMVWPGSQIRECVNIPSHAYLNTPLGKQVTLPSISFPPSQCTECQEVGDRDANAEEQQHTADHGARGEHTARRRVEEATAEV